MAVQRPHVVLVSGSIRGGSTSEKVAAWCARQCVQRGATVEVFRGVDVEFPFYRPGLHQDQRVRRFLDQLAAADGVVLVSPTYHGAISGLLKNALDFANDLAVPRVFLDGVPLGCVAVGAGTQGTASTLTMLRTVGHALRAWPTPLGVTVRTWVDLDEAPDASRPEQEHCRAQLTEMVAQVLSMARPGHADASDVRFAPHGRLA
ncbi:NAD(P)H-dependent oxidoreductase [Micromonospora sp. NPDC002296]|uniref:NADPH-dependent FMN reductase n=1 Tax=Micromonospora sp. NPDC002296 TaxID=3154271 RepID=UPI0033238288